MAKIKKWLLRFFLWFSLSTILLFGILYSILQIPLIQKKCVDYLVDLIETKSAHQVNIGSVSINWFDIAVFNDLKVYDFQDSLMLSSDELVVNFSLLSLYDDGDIKLDGLHLLNTRVWLKKHNDSTSINISEFIRALSSEGSSSKKATITIEDVGLKNLNFRFDDLRKGNMPYRKFDYNHVNLDIPGVGVSNFHFFGDSISAKIRDFKAKDLNSPLTIHELESQFILDKEHIILGDLSLKTDYSYLSDSIALSFTNLSMLANIVDSVDLHLNLVKSRISTRDISLFGDIGFDEEFDVTTKMRGRINRLIIDDFDIKTKRNSRLTGKGEFIGLPVIDNTFIDLAIKDSQITENDLHFYAKDSTINTGRIGFEGQLLGFINDFVANGEVTTYQGVIVSDINLKDPQNPKRSIYSGNLQLKKFDIGSLVGQSSLGQLNFEGSINGSGLTPKTANFYLNAKAENIEIRDKVINEVKADGRFSSRFFSGSLKIIDEDINLVGIADIDFSKEEELVDFTFNVNHLDLYSLGITKKPLTVSSDVDVEVKNFDINTARGIIKLDSTVIAMDADTIGYDLIRLITYQINEDQKEYQLQAPGINARLKGDFLITELIKDLPQTMEEFWLNFSNKENEIIEYYNEVAEEDTVESGFYKASLEVSIIDLDSYLEVLDIPIHISKNTRFESSFTKRNTRSLSLFTEIDTLVYGQRTFLDNVIDINASKESGAKDVLAIGIIESKEQQWDVVSPTVDFFSEVIWYENTINLLMDVTQPQNHSSASLNSNIKLLKDTIEFNIGESSLTAFDKKWNISRENLITMVADKVIIDGFELYSNEQSVKIGGVYSDSLATRIDINFNEFSLENLSAIIPRKFTGILNAEGSISRSSIIEPLRFESDLDLESLVFEGYEVGNLKIRTEWNNRLKGLYLDGNIERDEIRTIDVSGTYVPEGRKDQINLDVEIDRANVNLIQPIFEDFVANVSGYASGSFEINGDLSSPEIYGEANLSEGGFTFKYLNTTYRFEGPLSFTPNQIAFDGLRLTDRFQNNAIINGNLKHNNFKNIVVDVNARFSNFELLNTTSKMNSLYHGNIYGTGDLAITGPTENIYISSTATTNANTKVYIPVSESTDVNQSEYITFYNPDIEEEEEGKDEVDLSGITLDFDIDVTPDAYVELIFDPRTGDIIRGRGNGNLQMEINTNGDFEFFGGLEINSGAYNFTTSFINKEFQIRPGGTITWYGDPYNGILDIEATYRQIADISQYNPERYNSDKRPVLVVLELEGSMMSPDIEFRIELEEGTNFSSSSDWATVLQYINSGSNNEELKRQVFSLLILRKFSPGGSFSVGAIQDIGSSVSEFVSNQLSYWLNQVDENLEVDIDLSSLDQDAFNTFQLRLAYTFLDGRLRVTRGGGVTTTSNTNAQTQDNALNILGDWSVEYLLTEDGNLRVKVFSRNQENSILNDTEQATGVSLQYVKSFNQFKELLSNSRDSALKKQEKETDDLSGT